MPIISFNFDKILIEKKNQIKTGVKVKNDINIVDVKQEEVTIGVKKESILRFEFKYTSEYQPNIANIELLGHIIYTDDQKNIKKIQADWKKNKKVEPNLTTNILNTILIKCNIKALNLSQELNLPPQIRLPTISPRMDPSDYIG